MEPDTFPPEIVDHIIDDIDTAESLDTLYNASLVNSTWAPRTRVRLLSHIKLSKRSAARFHNRKSRQALERVLDHIRVITLLFSGMPNEKTFDWVSNAGDGIFSRVHSMTLVQEPRPEPPRFRYAIHPRIIRALKAFPNVTTLALSEVSIETPENFRAILRAFPRLKYITFETSSWIKGPPYRELGSVRRIEQDAICGSLIGLSFDGTSLEHMSDYLLTAPGFNPTVQTLRLHKIVSGQTIFAGRLIQRMALSLNHLFLDFNLYPNMYIRDPDRLTPTTLCLESLKNIKTVWITHDFTELLPPAYISSGAFECLDCLRHSSTITKIVISCFFTRKNMPPSPVSENMEFLKKLSNIDEVVSTMTSLRTLLVLVKDTRHTTVAKPVEEIDLASYFLQASARGILHCRFFDEVSPFSLENPIPLL